MKYLIRVFLFNVFALWLTSQILPTLVLSPGWQTTVFAGFILSLLMLIVRPILTILFIPINLITFGVLSWLINVIVIYLLTVFVVEIRIVEWQFPGATWAGFVVPPVYLTYTFALILTSLCISTITDLIRSVSES